MYNSVLCIPVYVLLGFDAGCGTGFRRTHDAAGEQPNTSPASGIESSARRLPCAPLVKTGGLPAQNPEELVVSLGTEIAIAMVILRAQV